MNDASTLYHIGDDGHPHINIPTACRLFGWEPTTENRQRVTTLLTLAIKELNPKATLIYRTSEDDPGVTL